MFKNHDSSLSFYVLQKDQCTICNQFYNSIDKDKYNARSIYLTIKYHWIF